MKDIKVIREDSFSHHCPKQIIINVRKPLFKGKSEKPGKKVDTDQLRLDPFVKKFKETVQNKEEELKTMKWTEAPKTIHRAALEIIGRTEKNVNQPWMKGREQECENFRKNIAEAVRKTREILQRGETRQSTEYMNTREEVRRHRSAFKKHQRQLENQYWDTIIEEAKDASERNDWGKMHKTLKKLGLRDDKRSAPSEQFSAEEFKTYFEKVSKERSEHTSEEVQEVISWIPDRREEQEVKRAAEKLGKEVTVGEILEQMKEMSDGAARTDDVTIGMTRKCNPETQIVMAEKNNKWPEEILMNGKTLSKKEW